VQALLAAKAPVNARNKGGVTPLFAAAAGGHHKCVLVLLLAGADPEIPDREGVRAVDQAAKAALKMLVSLEAAQPGSKARVRDKRLERTSQDQWHTLDMYSPEEKAVLPPDPYIQINIECAGYVQTLNYLLTPLGDLQAPTQPVTKSRFSKLGSSVASFVRTATKRPDKGGAAYFAAGDEEDKPGNRLTRSFAIRMQDKKAAGQCMRTQTHTLPHASTNAQRCAIEPVYIQTWLATTRARGNFLASTH